LCSDLNIADGTKFIDIENNIYVFRGSKYWIIENFPKNPIVTSSGLSSDRWKGWQPNPDAVMIAQEGRYHRGALFEFIGQYFSKWSPDFKNLSTKVFWSQPDPSKKFGIYKIHTFIPKL
jgi:hypothetical protein